MSPKKTKLFQTAFDTFTATDLLGEGGAGRVYKAHNADGDIFAIKLLRSDGATSERRKRFKNELYFGLRNKHPHIVTVLDHGLYKDEKTPDSSFYVMPYYGNSLRGLLAENLSPGKRLSYFSQLLDGVEAAHLQSVVHRDLKPENILYDPETDKLLVADFGIAHFESEALYTSIETKPSDRLANFQYAAPEQRARGMLVDQRADIYALGLMLNEMFTNEIPQGTAYKTIGAVFPEYMYLDELVSEMIRQSSAERPQTIEVIKRELIGRGNEFVTRQRVSELRQKVVPTTDLDDPLINDPVRLDGLDWKSGKLTLFFSQPINNKWITALNNMGSYTAVHKKGPDAFSIGGSQATIQAREDEVQQIVDYFKAWLPLANRKYKEIVERERTEEERRLHTQLQNQVEEEERRLRILKNTRL